MESKELKNLKSTFLMYDKTIKETKEKMKEELNEDGSPKYSDSDINERISLIADLQKETLQKYRMAGGNPDDLLANVATDDFFEPVSFNLTNKKEVEPIPLEINNTEVFNDSVDPIKPDVQFDVIPLPSKGECYQGGLKNIPVAYLTANDENMIISPNLYKDGLIIDYLLKQKIQNPSIDPDLLLDGDREAIILWLRATGYGQEYPVTVTDNKTGIDFDALVDLSKIQFKPFTLKGDENGWFDYELPSSKDKIKFRFLTHKDNKYIKKQELKENEQLRKTRLNLILADLENLIDSETSLDKNAKSKLFEAKRIIKNWEENINDENTSPFTHNLTNKLEMSIMSINGNTDRRFIANYVNNMKAIDSMNLRKYIMDNEPGLDYNVEVERPESLGGGSINVFLSLDEFIFLNLA